MEVRSGLLSEGILYLEENYACFHSGMGKEGVSGEPSALELVTSHTLLCYVLGQCLFFNLA
jgi:hypothetical protein